MVLSDRHDLSPLKLMLSKFRSYDQATIRSLDGHVNNRACSSNFTTIRDASATLIRLRPSQIPLNEPEVSPSVPCARFDATHAGPWAWGTSKSQDKMLEVLGRLGRLWALSVPIDIYEDYLTLLVSLVVKVKTPPGRL